MNITQAIKMSAKSIFSNKARSALTMLGIIIGLAAVIVLVSYAQGQNMAMQRYYESMGTNKISVSAYDWTGGTDISQSLYDYCLNLSDQVVGFSPNGTVSSAPPIKFGSKTLSRDMNGGGSVIMSGGMTISGDSGDNYPTLY
ncbi:MAG: ABC transporter permease, partial [Evtepia gabavorous]